VKHCTRSHELLLQLLIGCCGAKQQQAMFTALLQLLTQ
jgi:hypothetical protein